MEMEGTLFFTYSKILTGQWYLDYLQHGLIPALIILHPDQDKLDLPRTNIFLQQDEAGLPLHEPLSESISMMFSQIVE
ncbi:hypothetical protein NQ318_014759 [Aromia moschata]|uniref:Uncharacterized protein n=1 Tax=Aromia moschata TaxID=1265417 RepID=A0AAV8ZD56_9CUCU|nr:hypothetical protein NQ318_014759 [Aromia moschata]